MKSLSNKRFIFSLGASRTGTTSMHAFFLEMGFRAIHFYPDEAQQIENSIENHDLNWKNLKTFMSASEYEAFSDYPTRSFYRELIDWQPKAKFILTVRQSTKIWADSMSRSFGMTGTLLAARMDLYERKNQNIRRYAHERGVSFLDVCVDDDSTEIGIKISRFLGCDCEIALPHLNIGTVENPRKAQTVNRDLSKSTGAERYIKMGKFSE